MDNFVYAEYCVIGAIVIDSRCLPEVRRVLPDSCAFGLQPCAEVYNAACHLADEGQPIDPVTVQARCKNVSSDFVVETMQAAPTAQNAVFYAERVMEGFKLREAAKIGLAMQEPKGTADETIAQARAALDKLAAQQTVAAAKPGDDLRALLDYRTEMEDGTRRVLRTGFPSIDNILGGLQPGGLYLIASRPSVGKSAFGIAKADMLARQGSHVLFLTLEMTGAETAARRIAAYSRTLRSYQDILSIQNFTDDENADLAATMAKLADHPLIVRETPQLTVAKAGILARNEGAEVLIIDYLGLMTGSGKTEYERITQISGDLKRLARTLGIVVIALCQLNRETEEGSGRRPKLSDLRSSGALEQDADGVLMLHRPEKGSGQMEPFEIDIAKNRHGRTGRVTLSFSPATNRFIDSGQTGGKTFEAKSWD